MVLIPGACGLPKGCNCSWSCGGKNFWGCTNNTDTRNPAHSARQARVRFFVVRFPRFARARARSRAGMLSSSLCTDRAMYRNARVPLFLSLRPGREVIIEGGGASFFCALSLSLFHWNKSSRCAREAREFSRLYYLID